MDMIVKILGVVDLLIAALLFLSLKFDVIGSKIVVIIAVYLIIKSLCFIWSRDIASMIEIVIGIALIISIYTTIPHALIYLISIYFLIKSAFSMLPS